MRLAALNIDNGSSGSDPAQMSGRAGELFDSYSAVETRRECEVDLIKEKLAKNEKVDLPVCRVERISADSSTLRFGLKRGKLLYLFRYPHHNVEREKHRNVITRTRFIKSSLEHAGYTLIPWDYKKNKPPTFWEERTMDEEDDDLYGPSESPVPKEQKKAELKDESDENGDEPMDEGLESGETDEEDESDSDLEIIIDKPQVAPKAIVPKEPQESKAIKIEAPPQPTSITTLPSRSTVPAAPQQLGTAFPAVKTSTIDVNADPVYPSVGKTITQLDIDADLAESSKPWRLPGADQSDYFNYGFDEFSWEMYRQRQFNISSEISTQKAEMTQLQQMFGMGGAAPSAPSGGVPGAPTGPSAQGGGMPGGMPVPPGGMSEEQMGMVFQQMAAQGGDMSQMANMDFGQFMQMMGPTMGGGGFGGQQQQQGGGAGYGQPGNQGGGGGGGGHRRGGGRGRGNW